MSARAGLSVAVAVIVSTLVAGCLGAAERVRFPRSSGVLLHPPSPGARNCQGACRHSRPSRSALNTSSAR
ncbi:MAG: hypothetical protein HY814_09835 [Candidatus Riflebacteria bacterium]|nr:hypothetical protein [Candidatus Riflebacteria bacterium]